VVDHFPSPFLSAVNVHGLEPTAVGLLDAGANGGSAANVNLDTRWPDVHEGLLLVVTLAVVIAIAIAVVSGKYLPPRIHDGIDSSEAVHAGMGTTATGISFGIIVGIGIVAPNIFHHFIVRVGKGVVKVSLDSADSKFGSGSSIVNGVGQFFDSLFLVLLLLVVVLAVAVLAPPILILLAIPSA